MTHTPGPWRACRSHEDYNGPLFHSEPDEAEEYAARPFVSIDSINGSSVVSCHDLCVIAPADAALLAAAPELLAVVERLITEGVSLGLYEQARAAFDKARGDY